MVARALAVWLVILAFAFLNGAAREMLVVPRAGLLAGRALSALLLSGVVFAVTWLAIGWIRPSSFRETVVIGGLWLAMTLAFEFGAGHFLFRQPWSVLLEDYDVSRGRIWPLVLVATALAPTVAAYLARLPMSPPR
jgi:hypothetical protein